MSGKYCFLSMARGDYPRECTNKCMAFIPPSSTEVTWKSCRLLHAADAGVTVADTLSALDSSRFRPAPPGVR